MDLTAVLIVESAQCSVGRSLGVPRLTALEHVANRPIVHHVLDGLQEASIDRLIVAGEPDALIDVQACVAQYEPRFTGLDYALCRNGTGFKSTLETVAPLVGNAPCLIHPADGLADGILDHRMWSHGAGDGEEADLVLYVSGAPAASLRPHGRLLRAAPDEPYASEGVAEIALFGPGMLFRARGGGLVGGWGDLADTGAKMAASGASVRVKRVDGWRRYRGGGRDLLELNRVALDRLAATAPGPVHETNRVEGGSRRSVRGHARQRHHRPDCDRTRRDGHPVVHRPVHVGGSERSDRGRRNRAIDRRGGRVRLARWCWARLECCRSKRSDLPRLRPPSRTAALVGRW